MFSKQNKKLKKEIEHYIEKAKEYAKKEKWSNIKPEVKIVESIKDIPIMQKEKTNGETIETILYLANDCNIPIATSGFFFQFFGKENVGVSFNYNITFNDYVKAKKGDKIVLNLGMNRYVSDIEVMINGKINGISASIINLNRDNLSEEFERTKKRIYSEIIEKTIKEECEIKQRSQNGSYYDYIYKTNDHYYISPNDVVNSLLEKKEVFYGCGYDNVKGYMKENYPETLEKIEKIVEDYEYFKNREFDNGGKLNAICYIEALKNDILEQRKDNLKNKIKCTWSLKNI